MFTLLSYRRVGYFSALFLALGLLTQCAENLIQDPNTYSGPIPLLETPKPIIGDGFTSQSGVTFTRTIRFTWPPMGLVSSWCISETQTEPPVLTCNGGQGETGGWSSSIPSELTLSNGNGSKLFYIWVRDEGGTLLPIPTVVPTFLVEATALVPFTDAAGTSVTELLGTPALFHPGVSGKWASRALEFDGSSSYLDLGAPNALRFSSSFSVMTWVKSFQSGGQILLGRYDPFSNNKGYNLHFTSNELQLEVTKDGTSTAGKYARVSADYATYGFQNKWRHVAAVYDARGDSASRLSLYIDGVKVAETLTAPGSVNDPNGLKCLVGISADESSFALRGQVGATAFFASAIPSAIVQAVFAAQKPRY